VAQRRTAYRWTITYDDPLMATVVVERVRGALQRWQDLKPKIYSDGWLGGHELGLLQLGLVVTGRDRWQCSKSAREFARALAITAHVTMVEVINPEPANLPSHDHRGRKRFLAPKYQEATDGA